MAGFVEPIHGRKSDVDIGTSFLSVWEQPDGAKARIQSLSILTFDLVEILIEVLEFLNERHFWH